MSFLFEQKTIIIIEPRCEKTGLRGLSSSNLGFSFGIFDCVFNTSFMQTLVDLLGLSGDTSSPE